jgi:hypothetical protein
VRYIVEEKPPVTCDDAQTPWSDEDRHLLCKQGVAGSSPVVSTAKTQAQTVLGDGAKIWDKWRSLFAVAELAGTAPSARGRPAPRGHTAHAPGRWCCRPSHAPVGTNRGEDSRGMR